MKTNPHDTSELLGLGAGDRQICLVGFYWNLFLPVIYILTELLARWIIWTSNKIMLKDLTRCFIC